MRPVLHKVAKFENWGILAALVFLSLMIGGIELLVKDSPVFFRSANILNILLQTSINTIIAIGMTFIIITAGIDLSVGSVLALCNVLLGMTMLKFSPGQPTLQIFSGVFVALIVGSGIGLLNGLISVRWRIPPFIVTLGMLGVARGLGLWFIDSQTENLIGRVAPSFAFWGNGVLVGIPFPAFVALILILMGHFLLNYTTFGRRVLAVGSNEEAARLCGINVGFYRTAVYVLGGFLVALAAVFQTSRLGSSNPTIGAGFELYAIAAVIVGGTNLMGGQGSILGTLIGALIIGVLNNGLTLLNIPDEIKQIIIGLVIIIAVMMDRMKRKGY